MFKILVLLPFVLLGWSFPLDSSDIDDYPVVPGYVNDGPNVSPYTTVDDSNTSYSDESVGDVQVDTYIVKRDISSATTASEKGQADDTKTTTSHPRFSLSDIIDRVEDTIFQSALNIASAFTPQQNETNVIEEVDEIASDGSIVADLETYSIHDGGVTKRSIDETLVTGSSTDSLVPIAESTAKTIVPATKNDPEYVSVDRVSVFHAGAGQLPLLPLFQKIAPSVSEPAKKAETKDSDSTTEHGKVASRQTSYSVTGLCLTVQKIKKTQVPQTTTEIPTTEDASTTTEEVLITKRCAPSDES